MWLLRISEDEKAEYIPDPDETPLQDRRLVTQPYDIVINSLLDQITDGTLHLRPLSDRPSFQRRYVWPPRLASRLIESILLNVPIPPCYLSQNERYELDVIDGQQRIFTIYRFVNNQFRLSTLEVLKDHNGSRFFELPEQLQRKLWTYTLRCVIITNDSHPEIRFDVFERLNTNTIPLNAQELRNSVYRGPLIDLLVTLAEYEPWLHILNRKQPDKRMRDDELILRFFAFEILGLNSYRTPQKHWLNDAAKGGQRYTHNRIAQLETLWKSTIDKCLTIFEPGECFRRLPVKGRSTVVNRALMDLTMNSLAHVPESVIPNVAEEFYQRYVDVLADDEFADLCTRAVDHKSRTLRRFEIWREQVTQGLL
jgi:hypothetical protein